MEGCFYVRKSYASAKKKIIIKKKSDASEDKAGTNGNGRHDNMNMEERKAAGLLWTDTEESAEKQRKARGQCCDFNHL